MIDSDIPVYQWLPVDHQSSLISFLDNVSSSTAVWLY